MKDLEIRIGDRADALAVLGEVLGKAGVSLEGGGVWSGTAHYLVDDGEGAGSALSDAGFDVVAIRDVITVPLRDDVPGQLGVIARLMAEAGVTIEVQYSDHDNRKILVVDDEDAAQRVAEEWAAG